MGGALWNVQLVLFFQRWLHSFPSKRLQLVRSMVFFATIWSIWLWRNSMVYNGKIFDIIQLFETIKLRLGWWCKAQRPTVATSLDDFFLAPPNKSIHGILRNHLGSSLVIFSKAIGVVDPVLAETIAIKEALKIFYASK
ncbi:reverse transcriptase [Gossypium australe]|uniref:Reverse transcriptase n=1 Tax=Gossypium australe TaxID=47621 RepID=A0A5B6URF9_9ROSI|nr:reverse transcriptase [Gossypium australe]